MFKKSFSEVLTDYALVIVFTLVVGYLFMHTWNSSIIYLFNARRMTMSTSLGALVVVWLLSRVVASAFIHAASTKITQVLLSLPEGIFSNIKSKEK